MMLYNLLQEKTEAEKHSNRDKELLQRVSPKKLQSELIFCCKPIKASCTLTVFSQIMARGVY